MEERNICLVGHDDDGTAGLIIIFLIIMAILSIMIYAGAFIGGYHSIKNYILAFKHNVIDDNVSPAI